MVCFRWSVERVKVVVELCSRVKVGCSDVEESTSHVPSAPTEPGSATDTPPSPGTHFPIPNNSSGAVLRVRYTGFPSGPGRTDRRHGPFVASFLAANDDGKH